MSFVQQLWHSLRKANPLTCASDLPAFVEHFESNDPVALEQLLIAPRKVFTGVKMVSETESGLYDSTSSHAE